MCQDRIRWGIIGTGMIARVLARAMEGSTKVVRCAIASRSMRKAEQFAREYGFEKAYGSYEDLLVDPHVQVIYNSLPNSLHCEWTIRAAEAGKHILCEKPLACTTEECQRMIDAAKVNNVWLMEAFMYRFHPLMLKVKEMIDGREIGTVRLIRSAFSFSLSDLNNIRLKSELCGGSLMDIGGYCVNFSRYIAGREPVEVFAVAHFGQKSGVDETLAGTLIFPDGQIAQFDCSFQTVPRSFCEVVGSDGKIDIPVPWLPGSGDVSIAITKGGHSSTLKVKGADSYLLEVDHFCDCINQNRPPMLSPEDSLRNVRVLQALLRSAREARPVRLE